VQETGKVPSNFFYSCEDLLPALSRKCLHDLTTARHFKSFCNVHDKNIYSDN
jgi:hypothetical protein